MEICADAADAGGAVAAVRAAQPDVAILDIRMPGGGLRAAAEIAAMESPTVIVMLTVSEDTDDLFGALRVGAAGYLLKGLDPGDLVTELRQVLAGDAVLSRPLVGRLMAEFRSRERRRLLSRDGGRTRLTQREWEVLDLLDEGLSTAGIAERLFVAKVTVRSHIAAILRKLKVADRDAALRVLRYGPDSDSR